MERGSPKRGERTTRRLAGAADAKQDEPMLAPPADAVDDGTLPGRDPAPPQRPRITPADVERRANLAKWLSDARFPADRRALLTHAVAKAAPEPVLQAVRTLPDERFHNVGEVATALALSAAEQKR